MTVGVVLRLSFHVALEVPQMVGLDSAQSFHQKLRDLGLLVIFRLSHPQLVLRLISNHYYFIYKYNLFVVWDILCHFYRNLTIAWSRNGVNKSVSGCSVMFQEVIYLISMYLSALVGELTVD